MSALLACLASPRVERAKYTAQHLSIIVDVCDAILGQSLCALVLLFTHAAKGLDSFSTLSLCFRASTRRRYSTATSETGAPVKHPVMPSSY